MSGPTTLTAQYTVRAYEVGPNRRLQPGRLADYLQETAGLHADALGLGMEELFSRGVTWLLSRLRVVVHRLPEVHEELAVLTWPSGLEKHTAARDFELRSGEELVARATSAWVVFDLEAGRMIPVPELIGQRFPKQSPPRQLDFESRVLAKLRDHEAERSVRARRSDLDMVGHVNNARHVEWALEGVPEAVLQGRRLAELDIMFRAEVREQQRATARGAVVERQGEGAGERLSVAHSVQREEDGVEAVRARSVWVPDEAAPTLRRGLGR